jgi:hypothetical protein
MRRVECELGIGEDGSPNVNAEGRNSFSQKCEGDENLRLCSPMFAYVRLCSLNGKKMLRALRAATRGRFGTAQLQIADWRLQIGGKHGAASGERGKRPGFKCLPVRGLISHCTGSGYENAKVRIRALCGSQSNREAVCESSFANWSEHWEWRPSLVSIGDFGPVH